VSIGKKPTWKGALQQCQLSDKSQPSSGVYDGLGQSTWLSDSEGGLPNDKD